MSTSQVTSTAADTEVVWPSVYELQAWREAAIQSAATAPPDSTTDETPAETEKQVEAIITETEKHVELSTVQAKKSKEEFGKNNFLVGPKAMRLTCPHCHTEHMTTTKYQTTTRTHLMALLMGITTCLCCVPYWVNSCKNIDHYCSSCGSYYGTYFN